jgi:hypothetical protein
MPMTRLIGAVMAVALLVSVAPVMAGDSFHALSRLPAGLSPLDDAQLATIEGGDMTDLQSMTTHVYQNTTTHTYQNTTIHVYQEVSQGDVAAAQKFLAGWHWALSQGDVAAAQKFLAGWLQR